MGGEGFFSGGFKGGETVFQCWEEGFSEGRIGSWFISKEQGKGGGLGRAMGDGVMDKLSRDKELSHF